MTEAMQKFLAEVVDFLLGHGHEAAANELADELDNEDTRTNT